MIAEVRSSGSYVEPKLGGMEELEAAIVNFLPKMRVGQKVMIVDGDEQLSTVKI